MENERSNVDISNRTDLETAIRAVKEKLDAVDLYGQLAEECSELAQAALKMQRILRGVNPTTTTEMECTKNLEEEFTDILVVTHVLGLRCNDKIYETKMLRWSKRLNER